MTLLAGDVLFEKEKKMKRFLSKRLGFLFLALPLFLIVIFLFKLPASRAEQVSMTSSSAVKISPEMNANILKSLADDDKVELPSGRKIMMKEIRRLSKKTGEIKSASFTGKPMAQVFKVQPAPMGIPLKNRSDLVSALSRPGTDTVELPSGRRLTVDQLRLLQPYVEKRLGRKLSRIDTPDLKGEALKVTSSTEKNYWRDIMLKPDHTVLEAPDGTRITVGDLKAALSAMNTGRIPSTRVSP